MLAAGERGSYWRKGFVAFTVARPPAMNGHAKAIHCDVVLCLGTWRAVCKRPTPARTISAESSPSGYDELTVDRVRAYPVPRSLLCRDYLLAREHGPWGRRRSRREGHRRQDAAYPGSLSVYCTIRTPFRAPDRASLGAICSKIRVAT
jgi:hypothetical protein